LAHLAVDDEQFTGGLVDYQADPMFVAVKGKERSLGPFMTNGPEHGDPIHFVESVFGINAKKTKVVVRVVFVPELAGGVNGTFDTGREASAELVDTTGLGSGWAGNE
jgi:hypothetical protein